MQEEDTKARIAMLEEALLFLIERGMFHGLRETFRIEMLAKAAGDERRQRVVQEWLRTLSLSEP